MEGLVATFKQNDTEGKGLIYYTELEALLTEVDDGLTKDEFVKLMQQTGAEKADAVSFEQLVGWLKGDKEAPEVVKGAGEDSDDSNSEDEEDDERDLEDLDAELEAQGIDVDFQMLVTRDVWVEALGTLDIDDDEAEEVWEGVEEQIKDDGLADKYPAQAGYPLCEFLEEMKVEMEDVGALMSIVKAIEAAKDNIKNNKTKDKSQPKLNTESVTLNRIVRVLDWTKRPAADGWDVYKEGLVPLSKNQRACLDAMGDGKVLEQKLTQYMKSPPAVNSTAGQVACRELCTTAVSKIIADCKGKNEKFTDPEWDMNAAPLPVLYVDKEKPGWDCTVGKPHGYKRMSEIVSDPVLFKDGIRPGDINQGQIGTCFLLGAMGAMVSHNEHVMKKVFIKYDAAIGVYGVRFCIDGEWDFVIVDDWMPVDASGRLLYARSRDPAEVWCPILEKAFCKLKTCYEMCDGGQSSEAIFNFFGGISGYLKVSDNHRANPSKYFSLLKKGFTKGWLMTVHFQPQQTAQASGAGKCGEATFDSGLVGGHCYSVLRVCEAHGNQLVCIRNPWGTGEWKGKWSDKNSQGEWTDEMKQATGYKGLNDGKFWMDIADYLANIRYTSYARPFGPDWKKLTQYKTFSKQQMLAKPKWAYTAAADDELTLVKGTNVEVVEMTSGWWKGKNLDGKLGYFPGNYVKLLDRPVAAFNLSAKKKEGVDMMKAVILLMQPDSFMQRKWYKRKQDGMNYKDTRYPGIVLLIVNKEGKVVAKKKMRSRSVWSEVSIAGDEVWKIYAYSPSGKGSKFSMRVYFKDGVAAIEEVPGSLKEVHALVSKA